MKDKVAKVTEVTGVLNVPEVGNVLLLSLFVLATVLVGAVAGATLAIRDLRSGRITDDGQAAYFAAESGMEQALYALRRAGVKVSALGSGSGTLSNGATFTRQVLLGEQEFYLPLLSANDFVELNLFNPDDLAESSQIESLGLIWQDDCGGCTSLEVSYTQWPVGASFTWPPNAGDYSGTFWKFRQGWSSGPWYIDSLARTSNYRLQVRSLAPASGNQPIKNLRIRAFADDGHLRSVDIPSRVFINVTGRYGTANQTLSGAMPRLSPLSGIFHSVLFGEGDILK